MSEWFYRGDGVAPQAEVTIRSPLLSDAVIAAQTAPEGYKLGDGPSGASIVAAVNVALTLRIPLLISGEPGSGKTQLGYAVAHELGKPRPFKFITKSTSIARELFYEYDAVRHFRASQASGGAADARAFISYSALGLAILLGLPLERRRRFLAASVFDRSLDTEASPESRDLRERLRADAPRQSVVIIDEIDKAPRDFPNDLLDEIDTMTFRIPEFDGLETPSLPPELRPIVFITTNSERQLPDAFLRRCAYAHLRYPSGRELDAILASRLSGMFSAQSAFLVDTRDFFEDIRKQEMLDRDPGVAELIQFLLAAADRGVDPDTGIAPAREIVLDVVSTLSKSEADTRRLKDHIEKWR
ncbi:MAG TPA: MoxR family ATPase [Rhizomicrobium sp.]|jgi:MoxR-like ATPase|nr:MoxR family ATPase [Rhizomicrobium sp.]